MACTHFTSIALRTWLAYLEVGKRWESKSMALRLLRLSDPYRHHKLPAVNFDPRRIPSSAERPLGRHTAGLHPHIGTFIMTIIFKLSRFSF